MNISIWHRLAIKNPPNLIRSNNLKIYAMELKRKVGYYIVRCEDEQDVIIAQYKWNGYWAICNNTTEFTDEYFDIIEECVLEEKPRVPKTNELLPHVTGRFSNDELERRADGCFLAITNYSPRHELGGIERKWIVKCIYKALKLVNDR